MYQHWRCFTKLSTQYYVWIEMLIMKNSLLYIYAYDRKQRYVKQGIAVVPVKYAVGVSANWYNQVSLYLEDNNILLDLLYKKYRHNQHVNPRVIEKGVPVMVRNTIISTSWHHHEISQFIYSMSLYSRHKQKTCHWYFNSFIQFIKCIHQILRVVLCVTC